MTKSKLVATLVAARALIETPAQWLQGTYAQTAAGLYVSSFSQNAVCFCSVGAAKAASGIDDGFTYLDVTAALRKALRTIGWTDGVIAYNDDDSRTHAEVLAVWDKAIEIAKAEAIVEALILAKEKIAAPGAWTQGYYAKDADGNDVRGNEKGAVCFCAYGAVEAATGTQHGCTKDTAFGVLREASLEATGFSPVSYNDKPGRTLAEVLAVFDAAIKLGQKKVDALLG